MRGLLLALVASAALSALVFGYSAGSASAHRARCHQAHTCPSDHATYRWRQPGTGIRWLCVKPSSDKRNATFKKRIVHAGLVYWCKR